MSGKGRVCRKSSERVLQVSRKLLSWLPSNVWDSLSSFSVTTEKIIAPLIPLNQSLSLAPLTSLRSIIVYFSLDFSSISWIVKLLQSHTSPNTLVAIRLHCTQVAVGPTAWEKLAEVLEGDRFPVLSKLELLFSDRDASSELLKTTKTTARHHFAGLEAKGVFQCRVGQ